jgi:transposase
VPAATFACPDLTTFCRLEELGLEVVGQRLEPDRDTVVRRLAHEPLGWRPTTLEVIVRRYRCIGCGHVWRQDTTRAAEPGSKLSRRGLRWALEGVGCQHLTVARVAEGLGVAWNTANDAVLAEGKRVLIDDVGRFDGVRVIGVDEHVWRHARRGDKYVTVIIDLTGIRDGTGPARLLDMVEGRSKQAFKTWLAERPAAWRDTVEVVAMDGFTGFKIATAEELPDAVAVMDPFHVVRLAGDALDRCRRRVDHPGTSNGPTEAINGRLEHLRGSALGFRNLTNCTPSTSAAWAGVSCSQATSRSTSRSAGGSARTAATSAWARPAESRRSMTSSHGSSWRSAAVG